MRFIKSFFSSKDPHEEVREKLLELEFPDTAVYLPDEIEEDNFNLVRDVSEELIEEGKFIGQLIGRKGWFLPNAEKKLQKVWGQIEKGKVNLEDIASRWNINAKRVYIAMEDYAEDLGLEKPVFHREEMDLYLISYFKNAWRDILATYDDDEEMEFSKLIKNARIEPDSREIFRDLVKDWLTDSSGNYVLGADGIVRAKREVKDLIEEYIPKLFEQGQSQVTYEELAEKYGMGEDDVGKILQKLIDERALGEVTLYATDRMIKPRL